jgi:uridine phosphorylase
MKKERLTDLILNPDGSVFHLKLKPSEVGRDIILVGDPRRVSQVSSRFDKIELRKQNREFNTHTGYIGKRRITSISTGIGTDNIDIVINELDALFNINLVSGTKKESLTSLNLIRIGTTGGLQENIPLNSFILTRMAVGFDGVLNFYKGREKVTDNEAESAFKTWTSWNDNLPSPYFVKASDHLFDKLNDDVITGITVSAPGFYGPQGRTVRLKPVDPGLNKKIATFRYSGMRITNYEMESSALYGLASMLGHQAVAICAMIANRATGEITKEYIPVMDKLISFTLERLFRN